MKVGRSGLVYIIEHLYFKFQIAHIIVIMRKQREQFYLGEPAQLRSNNTNEQLQEYVQYLRTQIKQLGTQIDFQFERASELIFSLYKHLYSPTQCPGEKATLLNKLSSFGVQWNLQSQFEAKPQEPEGRSEQARSINMGYSDTKDLDNNKKAYNMRVKTKPQKYRYGLEEQYDYAEKTAGKLDPPRRGRPTSKRENEIESRRVEQPNPYEKAPYKKRKSYIGDVSEQNGKEESPLREEPGRSSAKWESDQEKEEGAGIQSHKNLQSEYGQGNDLDKSANENQGGQNIGREDAGISPNNGEHYESQGKLNDDSPKSELVQSYRKYLSNPRLVLVLENQE